MIGWQEVLIRLLAALLFSGSVGIERYLAGKAAGVRTHVLVGLGSALFTMVSGYAFGTTVSNADRIAAQIVSGIGFIGGGAILKEGGAVKGLTTAAGLWAVASLGMAAGAGLYTVGCFGTGIILLTLLALHRAELFLPRRMVESWIIDVTLREGATVESVRQAVKSSCAKVALEALVSGDETHVTFVAETVHAFDIDTMTSQLHSAGARTVTWRIHEGATGERGP